MHGRLPFLAAMHMLTWRRRAASNDGRTGNWRTTTVMGRSDQKAALRSVTLALLLCLAADAAEAFTQSQPITQPAARNREASIYTAFTCSSPGENGRVYYLYQYTNRTPGSPLYRLVIAPSWGQSVGGRDWPDTSLLLDFIARGCHSPVAAPPR
jgi:hypothetical protein